jgi:hypothetical protein
VVPREFVCHCLTPRKKKIRRANYGGEHKITFENNVNCTRSLSNLAFRGNPDGFHVVRGRGKLNERFVKSRRLTSTGGRVPRLKRRSRERPKNVVVADTRTHVRGWGRSISNPDRVAFTGDRFEINAPVRLIL